MDCSIIIPARNEADRILPTLSSYVAAFDAAVGRDYEIIVVANDCSDDTVAVVRQFALTRPQITVIDMPQRVGKGGAILAGFRQARGNRIAFADADGSVDAQSLLMLLDHLADVDVAIGSRHLAESTFGRRQSPWRRAAGHAFRATVRRLFALPFADTQCGGKAFRREAARALAERVAEAGWAFDIELLLAARSLGFRTGEYAMHWSDSKGSQLQLAPALPEITKALWRLARRWPTGESHGLRQTAPATPDRAGKRYGSSRSAGAVSATRKRAARRSISSSRRAAGRRTAITSRSSVQERGKGGKIGMRSTRTA